LGKRVKIVASHSGETSLNTPKKLQIAVLEDDPRRLLQLQSASTRDLTDYEFHRFCDANEMIRWLHHNLAVVNLLSLDCDLDSTQLAGVDCGSGEDVVDFLNSQRLRIPVIIHSSNALRAPAMHLNLATSGFQVVLSPFTNPEQWSSDIRRLLQRGPAYLKED
jgi:hypothetical protein